MNKLINYMWWLWFEKSGKNTFQLSESAFVCAPLSFFSSAGDYRHLQFIAALHHRAESLNSLIISALLLSEETGEEDWFPQIEATL